MRFSAHNVRALLWCIPAAVAAFCVGQLPGWWKLPVVFLGFWLLRRAAYHWKQGMRLLLPGLDF